MKYRHELKYMITANQALILEQKLKLVMDLDNNSIDGKYLIKSLYFDDIFSNSYHEKLDGVLYRKKYRIRMYNDDDSFIRLECKHKHNNMTSKEQAKISKEMALKIIDGKDFKTDNEFINRFMLEKKLKNLVPSVIVEYERKAYTYPLSDVRITFDSNIRSGKYNYNLFDKQPLYDVSSNMVTLEVKFNEFLPEHIKLVLEMIPSARLAVSKFALCRDLK